ncbi:hypothetical protein BU24DRAFT_415707 [Aaosphaeria arxii CBS 175.79]|uniref:Uncharacterized protein n=1 Tax=Aaosphaeria arxii CBS 175.79 TaxID=1450172 RepID=A0A6A5X786_9PLEO|nr:uncharacterized protein BU24DRAFT_415707 [Aaosphaeria arxii CBS 175.79]KAF2008654.1 hypothetical protein BU24DRAFT_415707 [Aaosphaeria arxii CBS 175.79]
MEASRPDITVADWVWRRYGYEGVNDLMEAAEQAINTIAGFSAYHTMLIWTGWHVSNDPKEHMTVRLKDHQLQRDGQHHVSHIYRTESEHQIYDEVPRGDDELSSYARARQIERIQRSRARRQSTSTSHGQRVRGAAAFTPYPILRGQGRTRPRRAGFTWRNTANQSQPPGNQS